MSDEFVYRQRGQTQEYRDHWDNIFNKEKEEEEDIDA